MHNIEDVLCGAAVGAILQAYMQLMDATVGEALKPIPYGKGDTLGLDGIPEVAIANSLRNFDRSATLITEEIGATVATTLARSKNHAPTFYFCDPTDRSSQLRTFLEGCDRPLKLGDVFAQPNALKAWEDRFGSPASITGASSAITCVRFGVPICSVIVNFVTRELFVASPAGVFCSALPFFSALKPALLTPEHIRSSGTPVLFRWFEQNGANLEEMRFFTTFLGKKTYPENFADSDLIQSEDVKKYLRHDAPGGPTRPLYLSTVQPSDQPMGFVLANGEKIGEWIHWIPFVRFGKAEGGTMQSALALYEIHQERPWTKDGILMATTPPYSIFTHENDNGDTFVIDVDRLRSFANPSRVRSTILVASTSNSWAVTVMERHVYRRIEFKDES